MSSCYKEDLGSQRREKTCPGAHGVLLGEMAGRLVETSEACLPPAFRHSCPGLLLSPSSPPGLLVPVVKMNEIVYLEIHKGLKGVQDTKQVLTSWDSSDFTVP